MTIMPKLRAVQVISDLVKGKELDFLEKPHNAASIIAAAIRAAENDALELAASQLEYYANNHMGGAEAGSRLFQIHPRP